jgi:hypothetical protein
MSNASAFSSEDSYCSLFLKNVESSFGEGIKHIDQSRHHLAYDAFGDTLMRIRSESRYLNDCDENEKKQMIKLKEESARTLTTLREQINS